ncbi:P-loop containing nucleoside triphosphate hydrolase protein [Daedaleopsis nitida]|nr:P-loop containing nucleoside triphosphate hydrolase protein [Daedaleopsis nitida]
MNGTSKWFADLLQATPTDSQAIHPLITSGTSLWQNSLAIPAYIACTSVLLVLVQVASHSISARKRVIEGNQHEDSDTAASCFRLRRSCQNLGGVSISIFRGLQVLAVLALLGLSIAQLVSQALSTVPGQYAERAQHETLQISQCAIYAYLSVLGLLSLFGSPTISTWAYLHMTWTLVSTWGVYLYRDVWPLATFHLTPVDEDEGSLLWVKLGLLTIAGVFIPLFVPRKYTPVNSKDTLEPHPEQTASILSYITYTSVSPMVWLAYRVPQLPFDQFPPLPDYDHLRNMTQRSFAYLDPLVSGSRRHLGLKLMRLFWVEMCTLAALSLVMVAGAFAAPISLNNLLKYLEVDGTDQDIRPWLWIAILFIGQLSRSLSGQLYDYRDARLNTRVKSLVTELVFEHALRIRMVAETSGLSAHSNSVDALNCNNTEAVAEKPNVNVVGKINNLISSDVSALEYAPTYVLFLVCESPVQIILCILFLYRILGWSAFVGLSAMIVTLPVSGYLAQFIQSTQNEKMKRTDSRVQLATEVLHVIRMIKLFGWERRMSAQLDEKREQELVYIGRSRMLELLYTLCNYTIPILVIISTFFTYAVIMKGTLTAAKVFSAISVLNMLQFDLQLASQFIPGLIQAKVAVERIQDFLENTEVIDRFTEPPSTETIVSLQSSSHCAANQDIIGIRRASFTWTRGYPLLPVMPGASRRNFALRIEEEVVFRSGKLNLVVGPTGAGKTSLLMALLGEMHYIPSGPDSFVSLPRAGGVAYAAQESWVQNDTIRNNIVFNAPFEEVRYKKVLEQCALKRDLELFDAGDQTEVGERGITLSGGQKARISLARAVYSHAQILLFDDILAALDVHTSRWIVDKCLRGNLIKDRTVIMVTHNVAMVGPIADFVVDIGSDGRIVSQGSLSTALAKDSKLLKEVQEEQKELEKVEQEIDSVDSADEVDKKSMGKLVVDEEIDTGHVGWTALKLFLGNMSQRPLWFWFTYMGGQGVRQIIANLQLWYLGVWAAQYETHPAEDVAVWHFLSVYTFGMIAGLVVTTIVAFYFVFGSVRASRLIHRKLMASVLSATLRWLDKTPTARIIARCAGDIQTVDSQVTMSTERFADMTAVLLFNMGAAVLFAPVFLGPAILLAICGTICGHVYMMAQLSVKREMSRAKAPVLGHFSAAINGITSLRAYGVEETFVAESYKRVDRHTRAEIADRVLNYWMSVRVDFMGSIFTTALAIYLTYVSRLSASNTGFSLTVATTFSSNLFAWVRFGNDFEASGDSLERVQQYLAIEHEPESHPDGVPPAYWPASGKLEVRNLSARYSEDGPKVLHDMTFEVASGERVGIVGRTGSGKSSLTLALLRCILTEGTVLYDGFPIDRLNLDALRSSITIIPQVPELLGGTLRQNLDPFSELTDAVLNDALRSVGLFSLQDEAVQSRITLDSEIAGGGANLSVGQRQILALARAIVRQSKLLILDEATSAIDYETDNVIQNSLRTELGKDVTLLTVAHRLQTIMDADKVMVFEAGRIVEYGKPSELLHNDKGMFRALVDESGDRERLYAMAMSGSKL